MKVIFISLILIFLFSVSAEGSDWEYVCRDVEGKNKWYVDKDSIKHQSENEVRAWIKWVCKKNCGLQSRYIKDRRIYEEHDCKEYKYKNLQISFYYTDVTNEILAGEEKWNDVRPDTVEARIHNYLCKDR